MIVRVTPSTRSLALALMMFGCDSSTTVTPSPADVGVDARDDASAMTHDVTVDGAVDASRPEDAVADRADTAADHPDAAIDVPDDTARDASDVAAAVDVGASDAASATCEADGGAVRSEWTGTVRFGTSTDSSYLRLAVCGTTVSGMACETPDHDCYPIVNGSLVGSALHFEYTFGTSSRVTADLTRSADSTRLTGTLTASRCACSGDATYTRI